MRKLLPQGRSRGRYGTARIRKALASNRNRRCDVEAAAAEETAVEIGIVLGFAVHHREVANHE